MKESIGIKFAQVVGDGLKVHSGFSVRCYRKTRTKFLVGKDKMLWMKRENMSCDLGAVGFFFFFFLFLIGELNKWSCLGFGERETEVVQDGGFGE